MDANASPGGLEGIDLGRVATRVVAMPSPVRCADHGQNRTPPMSVLSPDYYGKNVGSHGRRMVEELIAVVHDMGRTLTAARPTPSW